MKAAKKVRPQAGAALLALLLGVLWLLPAAGVAGADEAKPALEVLEIGWDGHVTMGAWSPIRVKVTGASRDLDVLVEVTLENSYQTGPSTTVRIPLAAYAQEISLPSGATKEVTVWVPSSQGIQGTVRLKAGQEELGKEPFEFRATKAPYWPLVGVLTAEDSLAAQLRRIELPLSGLFTPINVARVKPEALPTMPDRLKGLRALVVQGNTPANLTDGQRKAIYQWVQNGGHLLLAGGPDSALTAAVLPAGSLPVTFGGAEKDVDLTPLAAWGGLPGALKGPAVRMQPTGGTVLAGAPDRPLAWRLSAGKGSITVLAADPTLEPLASAPALGSFLKKALAPALSEGSESESELNQKMMIINMEQEMGYRLRNAVDALPADAYPTWKQVALYLGGFALLAGPAIHLLFWRNRRRGWVWLAVPAASLAVASSIYLVGVVGGGRDMLGHTISYLQLDPQSQRAQQTLMVGIYAPMHRDLSITVPADVPINAMGLLEAGFGPWGPQAATGNERPPFRLVYGREARLEYNGNEGIMRPLSLSRSLGQEAGRIVSHLTLVDGVIKGTITNETPYRLEDAAVAVGSKSVRMGSMAPGQTVAVTLEPAAVQEPFRHYSLPTIFYGEPLKGDELQGRAPVMPPGSMEPMEIPRKPEIQRRSRMIESLLYRPKPGPDSASMPLTFIAFTQDPVGSAVVDLTGHPDHHLTLIEQKLQLDLPAGPFTVPASLIPWEMTSYPMRGMGSGSDGKVSWMEIDSDTVGFTYISPLPKGATITSLEITTQLMGDPAPGAGNGPRKVPMPMNMTPQAAEAGIFKIYNWTTAAWEELPGGLESVRLTNPAPYLGPESEIKINMVTGGRMVRFIIPQLTMEGRGSR